MAGITPHQSATRLAEWLQDMNEVLRPTPYASHASLSLLTRFVPPPPRAQVLVEILDQSGHMPHMEVPCMVNLLIQGLLVHDVEQ